MAVAVAGGREIPSEQRAPAEAALKNAQEPQIGHTKPARIPAALTSKDRLEIASYKKLMQRASESKDEVTKQQHLGLLVQRSEPFVKNRPDVVEGWLYRAAAAAMLDLDDIGRPAAEQLMALGGMQRDDLESLDLLAEINLQGWFNPAIPRFKNGAVTVEQFNSLTAWIATLDKGEKDNPRRDGEVSMEEWEQSGGDSLSFKENDQNRDGVLTETDLF